MRILLGPPGSPAPGSDIDDAQLRQVYAVPPDSSWLRVNFVSTVDGAATGADGLSGSINTEADGRVFRVLRELADVVVVGAGTVRAEQYTVLRDEDPTSPPLVVVSRTAELPARVADMSSPAGSALLVTRHGADPAALERARDILGSDNVILAGDDEVDLLLMRKELERKGFRRILSEGGPSLFGSMLDAGIVDEVDLSLAPRVVGGSHPRIVRGGDLTVGLEPTVLVEEEGTVMGRWLVRR